MTYDEIVAKMEHWRRLQKYTLWVLLLLPVLIFLQIPLVWWLIGWFVFAILLAFFHAMRTHYRNLANNHEDNDETDHNSET